MASEARSVVVRLTAQNAQFIAAMKASGVAVDATATQMEAAAARSSRALDSIGAKAGKAGLVAGLALAAMGKAAVDWESQFAGVEKTVDGTAAQMAVLEGELRGLAKTMPATHEEIAGVAEAAGQLGVAREDISAFTETMIQLGETTNLTAQDAATSIAQMANVMGTAPEDIGRVGAALVAVGNAGASTESQIIQMAQGISGAAAVVGLAEGDVLGIANAVASIGIEVEAGGTAVSRVLTDMAKATAQGGEDLEMFAEVAGVSADDFARSFEERPAEALTTFIAGLGRVSESGGDVFTVLDQLGLSDVRVSRALLGMAADSDKFAGSLDLANSAFSENTALTDEYGKRLDTTAAQVQIAWNQIKDAGIEAGAVLLPVISKAAGVVGDLASAFGALPGPVKGAVTNLLGITAVLGGGLWFGSKVIGGVTNTRGALADLAATSPRAARGLSAVVKAGAGLAALEIGTSIIDSLREAAKGAAPDVAELTSALSAVDAAKLQAELGGSLSDLLEAADTGALENLSIGIGGYVDKMGLAGDALDVFVPGLHSVQDQADKTAAAAGSLNEAIAGLTVTVGPERAAAAFRQLAEDEGLSSGQLDQLIDLLPAYKTAVGDAAGGSDELAGSQSGLAALLGGTSDAAQDTADAMKEGADATNQFSDALAGLSGFLDKREALLGYNDALRELTKGLKDGFSREDLDNLLNFGRGIEQVANTLEGGARFKFIDNAISSLEQLAKGAGPKAKAEIEALIAELEILGDTEAEPPIGAEDSEFRSKVGADVRRLNALAALEAHPYLDLKDESFRRKFGLTKADLAFLNNYLASPEAFLKGNVLAQIAAARAALNALDGQRSSIYIDTIRTVRDVGPGRPQIGGNTEARGGIHQNGVKTFADGGYGSDGRYYARQPMMAKGGANILWGEQETGWEAYISGKPGERNRNIQILRMAADRLGVEATHARRYAGGHIDSTISGPNVLDSVFQTWEQIMQEELKARQKLLTAALKDAEKRTEAAREELDTAKEVRDGWREAIESLAETIQNKLTSDVFGEGATFESIIEDLTGDRTRAQEFQQAELTLSKLGLDDDALQALLEQTSPEQLIDFANVWTREQVDQFEQLFNSTQDARERAGLTGGGEVFGERENAAQAEVVRLKEQLAQRQAHEKRLEDKLETMNKQLDKVKKAAGEDGPDRFAAALNRKGGNMRRNQVA